MGKLNKILKKKSEQLGYVNVDVSCLKPEAVDKRIIADISLFVMDCKDIGYDCNIIIVSGDGDYLYLLSKLKQKLHVKSISCFTRTDASANIKKSNILDNVVFMFNLDRKNNISRNNNNMDIDNIHSDEKVSSPIKNADKYGMTSKYNRHRSNIGNRKCNNPNICEYYTGIGCKFAHDPYNEDYYSKFKLYKRPSNNDKKRYGIYPRLNNDFNTNNTSSNVSSTGSSRNVIIDKNMRRGFRDATKTNNNGNNEAKTDAEPLQLYDIYLYKYEDII